MIGVGFIYFTGSFFLSSAVSHGRRAFFYGVSCSLFNIVSHLPDMLPGDRFEEGVSDVSWSSAYTESKIHFNKSDREGQPKSRETTQITILACAGGPDLMRITLLILLSIFLFSCNNSKKELYTFDPRILEEKEICLSEIADEISYIPLDNIVPIGLIYDNIEIVKDKIYISVRDVGILVFNMEGKLIKKIGSIGRGPGEYTYYFLFTVDDKNENIYVFDRGEIIKVFSKTGRFVRHFPVKEFGSMEKMQYFNSKLFVLMASQFSSTENEWIFLDTIGNVIKKQPRKLPQFSTNWGNSYPVYKYDNSLTYYNIFSDTVFSISSDLIEIPKITIRQGEYRLPKKNLTLDQMLSKKYLMLSKLTETNHFILIRYSISGSYLALVNKKDYSAKSINLEYSNSVYNNGLTNDIDGGCFLLPDHYYSENGNEYLIGIQYPYQIIARAASEEFKDSNPIVFSRKMVFEKLAASLKETDNPVLVMVRLKQ